MGLAELFLSRFLGPVRSVTPLNAGACEMPLMQFAIASFLSAFLWAAVVLLPGGLGGGMFRGVMDIQKRRRGEDRRRFDLLHVRGGDRGLCAVATLTHSPPQWLMRQRPWLGTARWSSEPARRSGMGRPASSDGDLEVALVAVVHEGVRNADRSTAVGKRRS